MFQFPERISIGNPANFIEAPSRTPPATDDSIFQCNVESCAINTCLSARNYFHVPLGMLNRRSEQCPRARLSRSRFVQAHVCDGARLWARRSPHRCLCVHASDIRLQAPPPNDRIVYLAKRLVVPFVRASIGQFLNIDQFKRSAQNVKVSLVRKILRRFIGIHDLS